jgi:hypothetical protein
MRVGDHSLFSAGLIVAFSPGLRMPLSARRTRNFEDAAIGCRDAWAVAADILIFHQARLINEGYLRTALELPSFVKPARLAGYEAPSGVSASMYLASVWRNTRSGSWSS